MHIPSPKGWTALSRVVERVIPFVSIDGRPFGTVFAANFGRRALPLRSPAFRDWFFAEFVSEYQVPPTLSGFNSAIHFLECQASCDHRSTGIAVGFRTAITSDPSRIRIDLANPGGDYIEIGPSGWEVKAGLGAPFETTPTFAALPAPVLPPDPAATLDSIRDTLKLGASGSATWRRAFAWLMCSLRPPGHGPYPVLILRGPSISGKTFAARMLRSIVDPSVTTLTPIPATVRQLHTLARQTWVLAFDNLPDLSPAMSDAICRLASGATISVREPGCPDPLLRRIARPIVLTVPESWTPPPDLASRSLTIDLPAIPDSERRPESALLDALPDFPHIVGALCAALSQALAAGATAIPAAKTRLLEALAWAIGAAGAIACTPEQMRDAFDTGIARDPFVDALVAFLRPHGEWTGAAGDLLAEIGHAPNPRALRVRLDNATLALAAAGIRIAFHRKKDQRTIILSSGVGLLACPSPPSGDAPQSFASPSPPPSGDGLPHVTTPSPTFASPIPAPEDHT